MLLKKNFWSFFNYFIAILKVFFELYMEDLLKDKKFEAVKYRHEDQAKLLQYMTTLESQLFRGFLTIQLIFGGFFDTDQT